MGIKFNPLPKGFDLVSSDNFSYKTISSSKLVKIPDSQQMVVYKELVIEGSLVIEGELFLFDLDSVVRIVDSGVSESINIELCEVIRQTSSGITTSFSGAIVGSSVVVTNRSGADNVLNITIQGTASPTLKNLESFSLVYNGTDYDFA